MKLESLKPPRRVPRFTPVPRAESFAAAWDAILAKLRALRKSTHERLWRRLFHGTLKPVMRVGRHVGTLVSPDNDAVLRPCRQKMQRRRLRRRHGRKVTVKFFSAPCIS
jgi:hypothetical protein